MASKAVHGYGIDFGTTNSVVAVMTDARRSITALLDADGLPHPSVVWYQPGEVVVGREAKKNLFAYAEMPGHQFIRSIKRYLGTGRTLTIAAERRSAVEVATEIFKHLKKEAAAGKTRYDVHEAVVTIPVGFDGRARRDLREAAALAGIHINTFVHEPFAAVVGDYQARGYDLASLPSETVLVFDWGGGTLDITITKTREGQIEEVAAVGLPDVAGDRFDEAIRKWASSRFVERHQVRPDAFAPAARTMDRLVEESEARKIDLSSNEKVAVRVANVLEIDGQRMHINEPLDRSAFEDLIKIHLESAMHKVREALGQAGITADEVDRALLIGGSSEIPLLRKAMRDLFGTRAVSVQNSQSVIAEGAAAVAFYGYQPVLSRPVKLMLSDGSALEVFDRDTLLPAATKDVTLFCTDNRDGEARLIVAQERRPGDRTTLFQQAVLRVPVSRELPRPYSHERVYATFGVDENLVLNVKAYGAAQQRVAALSVPDLTFGLRIR